MQTDAERASEKDRPMAPVQYTSHIFEEVSTPFSSQSYRNQDDTKTTASLADLEKGGADTSERFDLRDYLRTSADAQERAGIRHKHVGVTWEDLQVEGIGGSRAKVLCFGYFFAQSIS